MTTSNSKAQQRYFYGTGRRKTSIAQVRVYQQPGNTLLNNKPLAEVIPVDAWRREALKPLEVVAIGDKVTVKAKVHGGGIHGQAGALSHGLARALVAMDESMRPALKRAGMLHRDPRMKESKKYGLRRARKAPQYTKR